MHQWGTSGTTLTLLNSQLILFQDLGHANKSRNGCAKEEADGHLI